MHVSNPQPCIPMLVNNSPAQGTTAVRGYLP